MAKKEPASNRKAVRIPDTFTINYNIITQEEYEYIFEKLNQLPRELNHLIKFTNEKLTI